MAAGSAPGAPASASGRPRPSAVAAPASRASDGSEWWPKTRAKIHTRRSAVEVAQAQERLAELEVRENRVAPRAAATLELSIAPRDCRLQGPRRAAPLGRPREESPRLGGVGPDDGRVPRAEQRNLVLENGGARRLLRRPAQRALEPTGLASLRQRVLAGCAQPVAARRRRRRPSPRTHRAHGRRRDAACNPMRRPVLSLAPRAAVAPAAAPAAPLGDAARAAHVALAQDRGAARRRHGRPRRASDSAAHLIR